MGCCYAAASSQPSGIRVSRELTLRVGEAGAGADVSGQPDWQVCCRWVKAGEDTETDHVEISTQGPGPPLHQRKLQSSYLERRPIQRSTEC